MILQEGSMEVKLKQQISNRNELGIFTQFQPVYVSMPFMLLTSYAR